MHTITKEFDFCYGHRVHTQVLDKNYSIDDRCVCRHFHGHQGKIIVELTGEINSQSMVTDFKHLNWFKKFIDEDIDHKFIMDLSDPIINNIPFINKSQLLYVAAGDYYCLPYSNIQSPAVKDVVEGIIFVDFVPTSEKLSKWFFKLINEKMKPLGVCVSKVTFKETPKTSAQYTEA
jgi:6-pyruvoyltetrahydropterin/6-carboxytetrahydropterin synthase